MNERYLKEEQRFRKLVKSAIKMYFSKENSLLEEESKFRKVVRKLILEVAVEDPESDPHEYTGINYLRRLFKDTNVLKTLKSSFVSLTTDPTQRESFRAHIISWVLDTLNSVKANDLAPANINKYDDFRKIRKKKMNIQEEVDVEFLDVEDEEAQGAAEKEIEDAENQQKEKEAELRELPEQDTTGRNAAASTYNVIETSIVSYFSQLSNEDDQEIFIDWLITNLKMYFDKWEKELSGKVQEPTNTEYEQQAQETEAEASPPAPPQEGEVAPLETAEAPDASIPADTPAGPPAADTGGISPEEFEAELNAIAGMK